MRIKTKNVGAPCDRHPLCCGNCRWGDHHLCWGPCVCADVGHRPNQMLARRMALYRRPDIDGGVDQDTLIEMILTDKECS